MISKSMKKCLIVLGFILILNYEGFAIPITSAHSGSWSTATNWSPAQVPGVGDDVTIQDGITIAGFSTNQVHNITINSGSLTLSGNGILNFSGLLTIKSGRTLSLTGTSSLAGGDVTITGPAGSFQYSSTASSSIGTLTIAGFFNPVPQAISLTGNFTVNSSFFATSGTSVTFNGSSLQTIFGTGTFYNINIANGANVVIDDAAEVDLNGVLTLQSATSILDADGVTGTGKLVVVSSGASSGGNIAALPNTSNLSGIITVQRYLPGKGGGDYRYLSVPISSVNLSSWQDAFGVTGSFADNSQSTSVDFPNINDAGNQNASVFQWDISTQTFTPISGSSVSAVDLVPSIGYVAYDYNDGDIVIDYRDGIQKGNVPITISSTSGNYNLIPNPYPSQIDWDNVNITGLGTSMNLRMDNGVFATYPQGGGAGAATNPPFTGWTGEVAIGQSFWALSSGGSSTLTLTESCKTSNQAQFVRTQTLQNYVRLTLASSTQKDESLIIFDEYATDGKGDPFDAPKFRNGIYTTLKYAPYLNISSFTADSKSAQYSINTLSEVNGCSKTVGLKISDVNVGDHSLTFTDLSTMSLGYSIVLVDHFLNKENVIADNFKYSFAVTPDVSSYGDSRFEIRFENPVLKPAVSVKGQTLTSSIKAGNQWYKDGQIINGATGTVYDASASGPGVYTVKTTTNGCEASSDNITMSVTGIAEIPKSPILVYPNPTTNITTISLPAEMDESLTGVYLYDILGSKVTGSDIDNSLLKQGDKSLDLTSVKSGIYILNIISGSQVKSIRLVKK